MPAVKDAGRSFKDRHHSLGPGDLSTVGKFSVRLDHPKRLLLSVKQSETATWPETNGSIELLTTQTDAATLRNGQHKQATQMCVASTQADAAPVNCFTPSWPRIERRSTSRDSAIRKLMKNPNGGLAS